MTKEEYLKMYKEDKLAEICERFEKDMNCYHDQFTLCRDNMYKAQKNADEFSSYWKNVDRLFEKLKSIPAEDFIKLYYRMQDMINNHIRYENISTSKQSNLDKVITTITNG